MKNIDFITNKDRIKYIIKTSFLGTIYLWLIRLLIPKKYTKDTTSQISSVIYLTDSNNAVFFGYHDKTPFSADNSKILAMSVQASDKRPDNECTLMKIGYYQMSLENSYKNKFVSFAETTTWSWQQGCMLQWYPSNPNEEVIFNTLVDGNYGSMVYNITKQKNIKTYKYPIYSIDPKGKLAVTLNFSRLGRLRPGYGYNLLPDNTINEKASVDDGLFIMDLKTKERKLIVSLEDLASQVERTDCEHYINHATFSFDSKHIAFFHLWVDKANKRQMRFLSYNLEESKQSIIEEKTKVSHYCWINDSKILATVKNEKEKNWAYCIYDNKKTWRKVHTALQLNTDGHPMQSPVNNNIFVTDSRLNKLREDNVILFNTQNGKRINVARFFLPFRYQGQVRCDLHPRWDRSGHYIAADVVHKNRRAMAIINIKSAFEKILGDET